eukprot:UN23455
MGVTRSCDTCGWWSIQIGQWGKVRPKETYLLGAESHILQCEDEPFLVQPYDWSRIHWLAPLIDKRHRLLWCPVAKCGSTTIMSLYHRIRNHKVWKVEDIEDTETGWKKFDSPFDNDLMYLYHYKSRFGDSSRLFVDPSGINLL